MWNRASFLSFLQPCARLTVLEAKQLPVTFGSRTDYIYRRRRSPTTWLPLSATDCSPRPDLNCTTVLHHQLYVKHPYVAEDSHRQLPFPSLMS